MNEQLIKEGQALYEALNDALAGLYKNNGELNMARSRRVRQLSLEVSKFQKKLREGISAVQAKARTSK